MGIAAFLGLVVVLGMIGGVLIYFLRQTLNTEDSRKIDPYEEQDFNKKDLHL